MLDAGARSSALKEVRLEMLAERDTAQSRDPLSRASMKGSTYDMTENRSAA